MLKTTHALALALIAGGALKSHAQTSAQAPPPPATVAAIGPWSVAIVERVQALLSSPARWNHADASPCPAAATTFSIRCAFKQAIDEATGVAGATRKPGGQPPLKSCTIPLGSGGAVGTCGAVFDEVPVFTLARAPAITTGMWRDDMKPSGVWAGSMTDAENPALDEADNLVDSIAPKKYSEQLKDYNNDPGTTFADVQMFLHRLRDRVAAHSAANTLDPSVDDVEIEVYPGGTGVIRTYTGWFAVSGFVASESNIRFQIDTTEELPANALDRKIIERASAILTSDSVWNRADNRKCPVTETKWSIYCALEQATIDVTGGFHHRRPALELVRVIVDDRTAGRDYNHRLMDYNNDPTTHLADVRSLFAEALTRIK